MYTSSELEMKKQAAIDYICGVEKKAGLGAQIGKALVSPLAKKIYGGAGVGAGVGALTAKGDGGEDATIGDRLTGAVTGGIVGGAVGGAAHSIGSSFKGTAKTPKPPKATSADMVDDLSDGISKNNPFKSDAAELTVNSSVMIDKMYAEKLAEEAGPMKFADVIEVAYREVLADDVANNPENFGVSKKRKMKSPDQVSREFPSTQQTLKSNLENEDLTYEA